MSLCQITPPAPSYLTRNPSVPQASGGSLRLQFVHPYSPPAMTFPCASATIPVVRPPTPCGKPLTHNAVPVGLYLAMNGDCQFTFKERSAEMRKSPNSPV